MLIVSFFTWWYSRGWLNELHGLSARLTKVANIFSVPILLRTMFNPWKQITTTSFKDSSLDEKIKALVDNIFSRIVGFFVRLIALFLAFISILITGVYSILRIILWPAIPLLPFIFTFIGLTGGL